MHEVPVDISLNEGPTPSDFEALTERFVSASVCRNFNGARKSFRDSESWTAPPQVASGAARAAASAFATGLRSPYSDSSFSAPVICRYTVVSNVLTADRAAAACKAGAEQALLTIRILTSSCRSYSSVQQHTPTCPLQWCHHTALTAEGRQPA